MTDPSDPRITKFPLRPSRRRTVRHRPVPDGKLEMVITYLEMRERPTRPTTPHRAEKLALMRAEQPTLSFYRYLYDTVGEPWMWYERRRMSDDTLRAIIHDRAVRVFVLYVAGVPAGFVELDAREEGEVELAYFGLVPEFMGRGLGPYLLDWAVDEAWSYGPERVWVHTCNFDHPKAIAVYQRAGFVAYRQETKLVDDPRLDGTLPPSAGPRPKGGR